MAIARGATPGLPMTTILTASAAARLTLELLRGDARPHWLSVSEAQWTSLGITLVLTVLRGAGMLPVSRVGDGLTFCLFLGAAVLAICGDRLTAGLQLDEIARALQGARGGGNVFATPQGLRVSCGRTAGADHYSLSADPPLPARTARRLAAIVRDTAHPDARAALVAGGGGGWALVVEGGPRKEPALGVGGVVGAARPGAGGPISNS